MKRPNDRNRRFLDMIVHLDVSFLSLFTSLVNLLFIFQITFLLISVFIILLLGIIIKRKEKPNRIMKRN